MKRRWTGRVLVTPVVPVRPAPHIEETAVPEVAEGGVEGGIGVPGGRSDGVLTGIVRSTQPPVIEPSRPTPADARLPSKTEPVPVRIPVSTGVQEGRLIHRVLPVYPLLARRSRIEGQVVFTAIIGRDGTIQNLRVMRGHPLLVDAAAGAVRQWRYVPTLLNDDPVEVITQIEVNFRLQP